MLFRSQGGTAQASVTISVTAINTDPIANGDSYETAENAPLVVDGNTLPGVLANDTDSENNPLIIADLIDDVDNGILSMAPDGLFTYTPNEHFFGLDSFIYAIEDGQGGTAQASVLITVTEVNTPPVALDDDISLDEDEAIILDVLANDSDEDGDPLTILEWQTNNGTVTQQGDVLSYLPDQDFNGIDSFTYFIDDGNDHIQSALVTLTINPVNDLPIAIDDNFTLVTGIISIIDVLSNDSDIENDNAANTD